VSPRNQKKFRRHTKIATTARMEDRKPSFLILLYCLVPASLVASKAEAVQYQVDDFTISVQSTLGYTLGARTAPLDNGALSLNNDDGDRNFRSGLMANRLQALEQVRISDGNYGLRGSFLAWIDTAYLQNNKNNSPATFNSTGIGPQSFPSGTVANEGRRIEPLALFVYGAEYFNNGNNKLSWQVGRQTITWGESLFSTTGLSGLQAPIDAYQGSLLPNPEAQALFLPTGAARFGYSIGSVQLEAYWQFEYEPDILSGVGSYFSSTDELGPGAERLLTGGGTAFLRAPDIRPANGLDQFGFAAHDTVGQYQFGLYFVRGIPKTPSLYTDRGALNPLNPAQSGKYVIAYAQPVNAYAVSASTVLLNGENIAGELSARTNQPLVSGPTFTSASPANYSNPLYAAGDVMNFVVNTIYITPPLPLMPNGATIEGELSANKVLSYTRKNALVPGNTSYGASFEVVFVPNWFPTSTVEIETPFGITNTFLGDSQYTGAAAGTSTYDVGVKAVYKNNYTLGLNYQRYAGPANRQALLDRDFVTAYMQLNF
jgi:hypothetical protein